jgi:hypothetical protein
MEFEVKKFNIRSRASIFRLAISGFITLIGLILLISIPNQRSETIIADLILGIIMILIFPLVLTLILSSKVIFDSNKVSSVSFFGRNEIYLAELKSFGVMIQSKYYSRLVSSEELDEKEMVDNNFIFLSTSSAFEFNKLRLPRHIRLEYRADVYQKIKVWEKASAE